MTFLIDLDILGNVCYAILPGGVKEVCGFFLGAYGIHYIRFVIHSGLDLFYNRIGGCFSLYMC